MADKEFETEARDSKPLAEEDIRLEELKEREKQRELEEEKEAFLYFSAAVTDLRIARAEAEYIEKLKKLSKTPDAPKQKIFVDNCKKALQLYTLAEYAKEKKNTLFSIEKHPDKEQIKKALDQVHMTENQFATVAFVACKDNIKKLAGFIAKSSDKVSRQESEEIGKIKDEAIIEARDQLFNYVQYGPEIFAKMLAGGLRVSCEAFGMEQDPKLAIQWSMYTEEILDVLHSNPILVVSSGLTRNQLDIAEEAASMGKSIRNGLTSLEGLSVSASGKGSIDPAIRKDYFDAIAKMQRAIGKRTTNTRHWDDPVKEQPIRENEKHARENDKPVYETKQPVVTSD